MLKNAIDLDEDTAQQTTPEEAKVAPEDWEEAIVEGDQKEDGKDEQKQDEDEPPPIPDEEEAPLQDEDEVPIPDEGAYQFQTRKKLPFQRTMRLHQQRRRGEREDKPPHTPDEEEDGMDGEEKWRGMDGDWPVKLCPVEVGLSSPMSSLLFVR
ncbi:hypothetical protein BLNAU_24555 [Blattamonas nauphoetae]|uniref:Uncharacterized protein n=1 Tax=Blattamonas nauphoetae TaxID=2049346 RepID=A0ABQ9WR82_9EUKA|nr:hypothetical protein BLNAU_24555 [Blattamonas nauphoetae]